MGVKEKAVITANPYPAPRVRPDVPWHPLDEAAALAALKASGIQPSAIALITGMSTRYVNKQITLTKLIPEAQAALRSGTIQRMKAYVLAVKPPDLQRAALRCAVNISGRGFTKKVVLMASA
jgi:hypothetical protein